MIKCPNCDKSITREGLFDGNSDAKIWNFDGYEADFEVKVYCPHCEKIYTAEFRGIINIRKHLKLK